MVIRISLWGILVLAVAAVVLQQGRAMQSSKAADAVILGGGIHGVCLAYYLTQKGLSPVLVEKTSIAAAASGKAGGFLARDWGSGPTVQLHEKSYDLHRSLAEALGVTSYRQVNTLSVNGNRKGSNVASWLNKKSTSKIMDSNTAQVTPMEFVSKVFQAAVQGGTELVVGSADGIVTEEEKVVGVNVAGHGMIKTSKVAICLGPWSGVMVEDWFNLNLPMQGIKSTSLVYENVPEIQEEPFACFCEEDSNGCHLELYPRSNGILLVCISNSCLTPGNFHRRDIYLWLWRK